MARREISSDQSDASIEDTNGVAQDVEKNCSTLKLSTITWRQKQFLFLCTLANFFSGCSFSVMAPFFPKEAEQKGMEPVVIGSIFSIFELIIFVSSPIIGNYLSTIGPRYVYMTGIFLGGTCNVLFGMTSMSPPHTPFIVFSFLTRSIQAFGFSCYVNTSFAIVSSEFPKHVSTAFGILQTATGTGLMLGPVIGGALYEIGGFGLPFYVIGAGVIINGVLVYSCLPDLTNKDSFKRSKSMLSSLGSPMVLVPMLSVCSAALGITFLEPTLAKHLEPFHLATVTVSIFFVIPPLMNSVTSPIWGYLTDTRDVQGPILVLGHLFYSVGFLIMGPSSLLPFVTFDIATLTVGLVLVGLTLACILITSMKCMVIGMLEEGYDNNIDTYGIVAGFFNCVYTFGGCFGPMLGGVLGQKYSLSISFTVEGVISATMGLVTLIFFTTRWMKRKARNDSNTMKGNIYEQLNGTEDVSSDGE